MKAILFRRYGGPEVLEPVDLPDPVPGPGEVLIDIEAASVIPGDWKLRAGHLQKIFHPSLPKVPGRDGAGTIAALGAGVAMFRPGDAVCFAAAHEEQGCYAERIVRAAAGIVALPRGLSFAAGAALIHAGVCAWIILVETAAVRAGMRVLVHAGAGAIGGMAVQLARHLGAEVFATCRASNADYVQSLGAHHALAYDRGDFADGLADVDVVVDLIGGDVHRRSYPVLRRGGTMVCLIAAPIEDLSARYGVTTRFARIHDEPHALQAVADLAAQGALRPQVSALLPLAAAADAHRRLERGDNSRGRIVLDINGRARATGAARG